MQSEDFRRIDRFFEAKGLSKLAHLAYPMFIENVEDALKRPGGGAPVDPSHVREVCENYLTEAQLKTYQSVAEKSAETIRRNSWSRVVPFWMGVLASIIANIIFAVILYGIYIAAIAPNSNQVLNSVVKGAIPQGIILNAH